MRRQVVGLLILMLLGGSAIGQAQEAAPTPYAADAMARALRTATARYVLSTAAADGQDLNTMLNYFIQDLRNGTFSIGTGKDIVISSDGDGALTITANGDGSDEDLTINLDDTANVAVLSSTTGVATVRWPSGATLSSAGQNFTIDTNGGAGVSCLVDNGSPAAWRCGNGTVQLGRTNNAFLSLFLSSPEITEGTGTGVTVDNTGEVRGETYKVTVDYTNVVSNGVTHDLTIATLPAKTFIKHILADVTTPYVCADTCTTATLSATVGSAAGGTQYLLSFDIDAAAAQFGDADAEFGASLAQATIPTPLGALGSWGSTSPVSLRVTSGTGDLATTGVTNLNAGSITFYITTTKMP